MPVDAQHQNTPWWIALSGFLRECQVDAVDKLLVGKPSTLREKVTAYAQQE
jgi:hypothetical protein